MKIHTKRRIDWFAGTLLALLLAPTARALGSILRRDHKISSPRTITAIKLLGGGNFALGFSTYLGFKKSFPNSKLQLLTTKQIRPFAEAIGVFDKVIVIDESSTLSLLWSICRAYIELFRAECIVDFEVHSKLTTCFSVLTCSKDRVGFFTEDFFLRKHLYTHLIFFNPYFNRVELFEQAVRTCGGLPATWDECTQHLMGRMPPQEILDGSAAVAVGCSELATERTFSPSQWALIIQKEYTLKQFRHLTFIGAQNDKLYADEVMGILSKEPISFEMRNACGSLSLKESLNLIASQKWFICIDSGLLHYARLLGVNVSSYWGPTNPATRLSNVHPERDEVHYNKIACSPCVHVSEESPCSGRNLCMLTHVSSAPISTQQALRNVTFSADKDVSAD